MNDLSVQEEREVWECNNCGHITHKEEEVMCWECGGKGEMLYQGKFWFEATPLEYPYTFLERLRLKPFRDSRPPDDLILNLLDLAFWIGVIGIAGGIVLLFG